jgi:hypothetical protein
VKLNIREIVVFGLLGAVMCLSDYLMELLPNIHLIGVFIVASTVVFRAKAIYPLYVYIILQGVFAGFSLWWIPYLYVWLPLWAMTMLLPKNLSPKIRPLVYMIVCACHGIMFGALYAPAQAIMFGLSFKGMIAWIVAGFSFDLVHCVSNFVLGSLICPIIAILKRCAQRN